MPRLVCIYSRSVGPWSGIQSLLGHGGPKRYARPGEAPPLVRDSVVVGAWRPKALCPARRSSAVGPACRDRAGAANTTALRPEPHCCPSSGRFELPLD